MKVDAKKLQLSPATNTKILALVGIGLVSFIVGLLTNPDRTWHAYLVYNSLFLGLGVGALFFLVIHYLAGAGWNVGVRRVPEAMASYLLVAFVSTLVMLAGLRKIYPWTNAEFLESDHMLHHKVTYFSTPFFTIRVLIFFAIVLGLGGKLIKNSLAQDQEGGVARTLVQKRISAIFLVLFAPMFTVFAIDLLKSLDPKWFSTMWGVYVFIGFVQAANAALILIVGKLKKHGYLENVTEEHHHDMGKYLFGWTVFWAYIGVSQYLLIWYANLPEETTFYLARQNGNWVWWSLALPFFRFFLPFVLLLPRAAKRNLPYLHKVCWIVLFGAWIDLNWIVMPSLTPNGFHLGWQDVGIFLGFLGLFAFTVRKFFSTNNLVPVKDPYLHETLHHHVY